MTSQHHAVRRPVRALALAGALLVAAAPAASALTTAPTAPTVSASADEDEPAARTTWAIEPADADGPDGRVSLRHVVEPGAEVTDHVALRNFSEHAVTFDVYASDGVVTAEGQFDLLPAGTDPVDSGAWISIGDADGELGAPGEAQRVEVEPEATVTLPVAVRAPDDATPGDHPAGIVASPARDDAGGVELDTRVGARLHLRVAGDLTPALAVQDVQATYAPSWNPFAPGELRLDYTLANTGNVRLGGEVTASSAGPFGWAARTADGTPQREVLPAQEAGGAVVLDAWPLGRLGGDITAVPLVVGDDEVSVPLERAVAPYTAWALPWVQIALLALAVGTVLAVRQIRRRREARTQARIDAAVAAARRTAPA
ncbi:hypothetical protein [Oerskovia flava]|uniref:hypothetical protein n=1 Tax=Oerskovia flava TaxID=2986422 RepID=UPI002240D91E|nr:hypothetical protein [Oerskovia sp. JB1-3-2]